MKYVVFELRKIFGIRYVWIFAAVMLALNCALSYYTAAGSREGVPIPADVLTDFFRQYAEDPAEIDFKYQKYQALDAERKQQIEEARERGDDDFKPDPLPNTYSDAYPDMLFYYNLYSYSNYFKSYKSEIDEVIKTTEVELYELDYSGTSHDAYIYRNLSEAIRKYTDVRDGVRIGFEYPRGWGEYFDYGAVNIFILLVVLTVSSSAFTLELNAGILPVIKTARHGRGRTAIAKAIALMIFSAGAALIFALSSFAVFGIVLGYSSPYNAIQVIHAFRLVPYTISVGGYFIITLLLQMLTAVVFSLAVLALSAVFSNFAVTYVCGLGIVGVNFLLNGMNYNPATAALKYLNIISVMDADPLFERYRSVGVFGYPADYPVFIAVAFAVTVVLLAAAFVIRFSRASFSRKFGGVLRGVFKKEVP